MNKDPIVEEVRKVRHAIEEQLGNDGTKYFDHLREVQKRYQSRVVQPALRDADVAPEDKDAA